jgi:hypothetical protein
MAAATPVSKTNCLTRTGPPPIGDHIAVVKHYFRIRTGNLCSGAQLVTCVTEQKEERMTKFTLIGAAAVVATVLAGPAMARHVVVHPMQQAESNYCATIEPGNPYSQANNYAEWSAWRQRGGWDSRGDDACARNPTYSGNF